MSQVNSDADRLVTDAHQRLVNHDGYCAFNKPHGCDCTDIALIRQLLSALQQAQARPYPETIRETIHETITKGAYCQTHGDPLVCLACEAEENTRAEWQPPDALTFCRIKSAPAPEKFYVCELPQGHDGDLHRADSVGLQWDGEGGTPAASRTDSSWQAQARPEIETPALVAYMTADSPARRDAAFLRTYAARVRDRSAASWEIPNTVASTLEDIADRLAAAPPRERGESLKIRVHAENTCHDCGMPLVWTEVWQGWDCVVCTRRERDRYDDAAGVNAVAKAPRELGEWEPTALIKHAAALVKAWEDEDEKINDSTFIEILEAVRESLPAPPAPPAEGRTE